MIIDRIERLVNYQAILKNINKALSKVDELESSCEEGVRYPFEGGFVFFQKGQTKAVADSQFEAHKKYIDVQLLLEGEEWLGLSDHNEVTVATPYSEEKDVEKYYGETLHSMKASRGMAYVCFPWDVHKAVFHMDQTSQFTKAVIKLEV
ncbi:hypothetical protein HMPREF9318_00802 [Streptococcus urinalis FB127-CNA-2]|uniref:YhcH/YjgK/YiaL family protein n=1 Tax=Streptococcus urinalis 2285-97 TaxID=764291 RepID=G5KHT6_9STRE|nr:YhcH/YjgK/YiaL family protein [Streptococcus urinalis]EHJ57523.1 YhcH/YjgK/YiaL family protein [Streptococcus urinalis 2285-97]EKS22604.1 hypothetical protein HMPREF9318_00802 [Streptococcus urinalis FB127-CNA-2]VEF32373.1 beta-galactosidase subunit beta [Streptococcus urinalis]